MREDDDDDFGRSFHTSRHATMRDIREALEHKSTDPVATAFATLVAPSRPWIAKLMNEDERRDLGEVALQRYAETLSVSPSDYSDLLEGFADPYSFEWSVDDVFASVPVGCTS